MKYILFLLFRLIDIVTTFLCLSISCSGELNPFMNFLITNYTLIGFVFINAVLSLTVLFIFLKTKSYRISNYVLNGFLFLNALILVSNIFSLV